MRPVARLFFLFIAFCLFIQPIFAQLAPPLVIYKNGNTLITGTWGAKLSEITTETPHEGGQHYRFKDYNLGGNWWDGFGLNLDNNGALAPINFTTRTHLRIAYRGLSTGHILQIRLKDNANPLGSLADVGEPSSTYKVVDIPLSQLGVGINLQKITEINISVGGAATGTGSVYIDAIELVSTSAVIYKNGVSLIAATWGAKLSEITTETPYEGGQHYRYKDYALSGFWDGFGLNLDNYGALSPINFTGKTHLRLAYRGLSAGHILQVKLRDKADQFGTNVDVGEASTAYKVVDVPLSQLSVGVNLQAITEIDISIGGAATGTGTLYVDAIELINNTGTTATTSLAAQRAARLGTGTNTAGWLESYWNFPANYPIRNRYTEQDFRHYAAYGAKTIRLPVIFQLLGSPNPPYTLNTAHVAFALVDSAIAWANRYNLNLIIDNHHGSPELSDANYVAETPHVVAIWQQLIRRYGYLNPERFFFEIYNEPNGISNANVKTVLQAAVNAIRATGDKHTLIVGGSSWNAGTSLNIMGTLADTNLIYTFHSYDPFDFCNQGFTWLPNPIPKGILFPRNATEIPRIKASFAAVKDWATQNNVPIFLGEFGVSTHADAISRCNWIKMMGEILDTYQIPACYWDTKYSEEAYGFFKDDRVLPGNATPCFATALHWTYRATPVASIADVHIKLSIAPNPATHQVSIKFDGKENATLNVFDILGKLVLTKKISSNNVDLDISHLIPNAYIIEVKTEEQIFRGKFIKN